MEDNREWKELSPEEKLLAIDSYLKGMTKLDDNDKEANKTRLEWIREHLPAYNPKDGKNYIFVSYSHRDYEKVYSDLAYFSYNSHTRVRFWYDEGLPIGKDWEKAAQKIMENPNCVGVVFYLSKNLLLSESVYKEIDTATKLGKRSFAIALDPEQYSAEKIFDEAKGKELRAIQDKQKLLEEFFPQAHTALIIGKDNVQARIRKISEEFGVTEEVFSDFVCEEVEGGLRLKEYRGNRSEIYIPCYIEDKPIIELSADFKNAVKIYIPKTVKFIDADKLENSFNLVEIKVDPENQTYYDLNGVLCVKKPYNAIVRAPVSWSWKKQFEDGGTMWEMDFSSKRLGLSGLRHLMYSPLGQMIKDPNSADSILSDVFYQEQQEMSRDDFKALYLKSSKDRTVSNEKHFESSEEQFIMAYDSPENRYRIYEKAKTFSIFRNIANISKNAFTNCRNIDYLFLSDNIANIAERAFYNSDLKLVFLPDKLIKLSDEIFCKCKNLKSVLTKTESFKDKYNYDTINGAIICGNITTIGEFAFSDTFINRAVIGESVTSINKAAFKNCEHLYDITFLQSVEYLGESVFENCFLLNQLALPGSLKNIDQFCFKNCIYLQEISLPSSIASIAYHSFSGCNSIKEIEFKKTKAEWYTLWDKASYDFQIQIYRLMSCELSFCRSSANVPVNLRRAKIICTDGIIKPSKK